MTAKTNGPDVRSAWDEMRNQRMRPMNVGYDPEFRAKLAEDHSAIARYNDYEYGRKAIDALGLVLDENSRVLEIGAGPGTLTIPLATKVKQVVVIESSDMAVRSLKKNLEDRGLENVEIVAKNWMDTDERELGGGFDLVVCSHFLWQMKDLEKHLEKMEAVSKSYCAVIQPAGRDGLVKEIWTEITGERYMGEFDPDADYFAYLILRQLGRLVDVRIMNYGAELDFDQEVRYIASFIGKYVEVDHHTKEVIEQYVSSKGLFMQTQSAVVMWWEAP
ncbi:MAG: class I SAM-dependent methyltransferase [Euryarchaeota archaeon]|nr:class I SAM-dependent methyltransferase [Euryarchaeota archaeon]